METVAIKKMVRMNQAIQFDTHKFVKHLTENGFTEQQAEVLAEEQVNLLNTNLATKADIADVKADIEKVKADLLKWMFGMMLAGIGLVVLWSSFCKHGKESRRVATPASFVFPAV